MSKRVVVSYLMQVPGTPQEVFPLLCPVREYEWIDTWDCKVIHTNSGVAELDCVFRTAFPQDGSLDTWVVSCYEPNQRIEFVRVNTLRTIHFCIHLENAEDGQSSWRWTHTLTGLTDEGDQLISNMTDAVFAQRLSVLEQKLSHFLRTGLMLCNNDAVSLADSGRR